MSSRTKKAGEERLIKKYPNRRLYDTQTSAYVTLSDIKELVMAAEAFKVVDAKTDEDLTHSILLQIILEEEACGVPVFSTQMLQQVIRFYGHSMQGFMGSFLEKNVQTFMDNVPPLPIVPNLMGSYAEQLQKQTEQMLDVMGLKRK